MKKYFVLLLMAMPLVITSCNDDEEPITPDKVLDKETGEDSGDVPGNVPGDIPGDVPGDVPEQQKGPLEGKWSMTYIESGTAIESCFEFKGEYVTFTQGTYDPRWKCTEVRHYKYTYNENDSYLTLIDEKGDSIKCELEWQEKGYKMWLYVGDDYYMLAYISYETGFKIEDLWFGATKRPDGKYEEASLGLGKDGSYEWKSVVGGKVNEYGRIEFDEDDTLVEHSGTYVINNENHHLILYPRGNQEAAIEFFFEWRNQHILKLDRLYTGATSYLFQRNSETDFYPWRYE